MSGFGSNQAFGSALQGLVHGWCDQRNLAALSRLLPSYVAFNGLTDGWYELLAALKATRALGWEAFKPDEWTILDELIRAAEKAVDRKNPLSN